MTEALLMTTLQTRTVGTCFTEVGTSLTGNDFAFDDDWENCGDHFFLKV